MRKIFSILVLLFVAVQLVLATTLQRMDLDDLTAESHAIIYGKVIGSRTEWDQNHQVLYTIYTLQPTEYLKGQLGPAFELREPGGERDGLAMKVSSVPVFTVGQEAVLFVWTDQQGKHQAIGFEQGALAVSTDPQTGQKMVDRSIRLGSAHAPVPGVSTSRVTSKVLSQLLSQIRLSAAKAGAHKRNSQ